MHQSNHDQITQLRNHCLYNAVNGNRLTGWQENSANSLKSKDSSENSITWEKTSGARETRRDAQAVVPALVLTDWVECSYVSDEREISEQDSSNTRFGIGTNSQS